MSDDSREETQPNTSDSLSTELLFQRVYDELRHIAAAKLQREPIGLTLQPTALVHEAYMRLLQSDARKEREWTSPSHLIAIVAEVMRRILVDNARHRKRKKRGGNCHRVDLELDSLAAGFDDSKLLELDNALLELEKESPIKAQLVVMRYFGGMTIEDACEVLQISRTTAHRHWTYARAWLFQRIENVQDSTE
jgi:RNA polymerase sigma factor (TIGR02999 family)